jgi:hypothetical protein
MRLLAYPDSALGKRRECVVFASHFTNGFFLRFFHPLSKKIFKKYFSKKICTGGGENFAIFSHALVNKF